MGRGPYRVGHREVERSGEHPAAERGLDAMTAGTLLFVGLCAAGRACVACRAHAIDDDFVVAAAIAAAAGLGLYRAIQRKRGR